MIESFMAPEPIQPDLPAHYLARLSPVHPFRTLQCENCGQEQPDAGRNACALCGAMWTLVQVWPEEEEGR